MKRDRGNQFPPKQAPKAQAPKVSGVRIVDDEVETPVVQEPPVQDVQVVDPIENDQKEKPIVVDTSPSKEKLVWIKMKKDHTFRVGGVLYDLKQGQKVRVPVEVRDILARSTLDLLNPVID